MIFSSVFPKFNQLSLHSCLIFLISLHHLCISDSGYFPYPRMHIGDYSIRCFVAVIVNFMVAFGGGFSSRGNAAHNVIVSDFSVIVSRNCFTVGVHVMARCLVKSTFFCPLCSALFFRKGHWEPRTKCVFPVLCGILHVCSFACFPFLPASQEHPLFSIPCIVPQNLGLFYVTPSGPAHLQILVYSRGCRLPSPPLCSLFL